MKRYHFLYKTTNLVNGKFYYGIHSADNLEEWQAKGYVRGKVRDRSYMGSTRYHDYLKS